ncbi:MAG: VanZ family protein [Bacteroidetes bacterium]|nr:VanZ family protein [Bacteroidota bacterium]
MLKQLVCNKSKLFAFFWALIIFLLCSLPSKYIPESNLLDLLSFDKLVHASLFFVLTSLMLLSYKSKKKQLLASIFLVNVAIMYGAILELLQAKFFSSRSGDWLDFIANSIGSFMALVFINRIKLYLNCKVH